MIPFGSDRIGPDLVGSGRIRSGGVGSGRIGSGQVKLGRIGSVVQILSRLIVAWTAPMILRILHIKMFP